MTILTLFQRMMLYDNQFDLVPPVGDDLARGLVAINLVQDWFESVVAEYPDTHQTAENILTVAGQETSDWPTRLSRLDSLWLLDGAGHQTRELDPVERAGDQYSSSIVLPFVPSSPGAPVEFWGQGQGGKFYWGPTPDQPYTIRAYGLWDRNDYTTVDEDFGYPDKVALVLVPHAAGILRTGLDRDLTAQQQAAQAAFRGALQRKPVRIRATHRQYEDFHVS